MKRKILVVLFFCFLGIGMQKVFAQCSVCTRTAQQLGEKPAEGLNTGILYLAFTPFAIGGYIYYRWRKNNNASEKE